MQRRKDKDAEAAALGDGAEEEDDFDLSSSEGGDDEGGDAEDLQGPQDLVGGAALRRAARAAGDDPLQKGLRTLTAELLLKHGGQPTAKSLQELQEDGTGDSSGGDSDGGGSGDTEAGSDGGGDTDGEESSEDGSEDAEEDGGGPRATRGVSVNGIAAGGVAAGEEEDSFGGIDGGDDDGEVGGGSDGEGSDVDGSDVGSMDEEEQATLAAQMDAAVRAAGSGEPGSAGESGSDSDGGDEMLALLQQAIAIKQAGGCNGNATEAASLAAAAAGGKAAKRERRSAEVAERDAAAAAAEEEASMARLPLAPAVPRDAAALAGMAEGLTGRAVGALVERIRSANAAALNADNRVGLQAFYGVAVGHYAAVAGARPPQRSVVEGMVAPLAAMAAEVPLYAATHARAHLRAMFDQAHAALEECAPLAHPLAQPPWGSLSHASSVSLVSRSVWQLRFALQRTQHACYGTAPVDTQAPSTPRVCAAASRVTACGAVTASRGGQARGGCCCCACLACCSGRTTRGTPSAPRRPSSSGSSSRTARPRPCTTSPPASSSRRCCWPPVRPPAALCRRCCRSARRCCTVRWRRRTASTSPPLPPHPPAVATAERPCVCHHLSSACTVLVAGELQWDPAPNK